MATRKEKLQFTLRRFKSFINEFKRSKRGIVGASLVIFFFILAILAPVIAPYDPLYPSLSIDDYPAFPRPGPQIAEELCYPSWYKFLPWVNKGPSEVTEKFKVIIYQMGNRKDQLFTPIDKMAPSPNLILSKRIAFINSITAYTNGEKIRLSDSEWERSIKRPAEIKIKRTFENNTIIEVNYTTGADITENLIISDDTQFKRSETLFQWEKWTNYPDIVQISYNDNKGFRHDGCIEITYNGSTNLLETPKAMVAKKFSWPYWEPPRTFMIHYIARLENALNGEVKISFFIENNETKERFLVYQSEIETKYIPKAIWSFTPEVKETYVKSSEPNAIIFPVPGNYSFQVVVEFPANSSASTKVYIDNLNLILYGNSFGLLGTDTGYNAPNPRDIFSTLVYGTRISLMVGLLTAIFSTIIGLFLGLVSGYIGGIVDELIMRFADLLLVLPTLPLFIVLIVALSTVARMVSIWNIIIILSLMGWMSFARSIRSMVLSLRERPFVEAAKAAGAGRFYIIGRHILPNVFALVYITLATSVPGAIITEASLSWLGLGDPFVASWGKMLYDFQQSGIQTTAGLTEYWFWVFPPCVAIALLSTAFILIGYALDEILNPKLRERR